MNPTWKIILQICYVAAVGALLVTVSLLAISAVYQMPSPHETGLGPHHPTIESAHDTRQKVIPRKGGGVRGQSRLPPVLEANEHKPAQHLHSSVNDDEEDEPVIQEEELVMLQRANPAGNNLKILGETKEQVKQEISQEEHSDHAFGAQLGDDNEPEPSKGSDSQKISNRKETAAAAENDEMVKAKKSSHSVQIIRRRGESEVSEGSNNKETANRREKDEATEKDEVEKSSPGVQIIRRRGDALPRDTEDDGEKKSTEGESTDADTGGDSADEDDEQTTRERRSQPLEIAPKEEASTGRESQKHGKAERKRPIEMPTGSDVSKNYLQVPPIANAVAE